MLPGWYGIALFGLMAVRGSLLSSLHLLHISSNQLQYKIQVLSSQKTLNVHFGYLVRKNLWFFSWGFSIRASDFSYAASTSSFLVSFRGPAVLSPGQLVTSISLSPHASFNSTPFWVTALNFMFHPCVNWWFQMAWRVAFTCKQKAKTRPHVCAHGLHAEGMEGEFKSKFGVRSGVHLSVHLRSVMRSAESFSREKHLITASVLRAPVAFRKEAKSLFSRGSEGKLITSLQTPGRDREAPERTEKVTLGVTVGGWCAHADPCLSSLITASHVVSQLNCKQAVTRWRFLFFCGGCSAKSAAYSAC